MLDLAGKTAVISGGAGGIGFALAQAYGQQGMKIVLGDIEGDTLEASAAKLREMEIEVLAVEMDVAKRGDWQRLADAATSKFGAIHLLLNNAGVGGGMGPLGSLDESGWRWAIDVNLMGVVYGADTFVPLMKAHGEPSWLINVASMAGMSGVPLAGSYTATKAAVVAMTESWAGELENTAISVSVLAPAFVKTRIHLSPRNRQPRYAPQVAPGPEMMALAKGFYTAVENGIDASVLVARVLEAMEASERYIFTHPKYREVTDQRSAAISAAFDSAAASPIVKDVDEMPSVLGFTGE